MSAVGAVALVLTAAAVAYAASGILTQLEGTAGCVQQEDGDIDCADGRGLDGASDVAVSNDGKHVYVASSFSDAVSVFSRDKKTGTLTQLGGTDGCVSHDGGDDCADGKALDGANAVAVTPDGKHVYVTSSVLGSGGVAAFSRDKKTGVLTQLPGTDGCVSETGTFGACADGVAINNACSVAVSPDSKHVYVTTCMSDAVVVFARDKRTGVVAQLAGTDGCVKEGGGVECAEGNGLDGAISVAVSPDGKHVYVASFFGDAIAIFARDKRMGVLTQLAGTDGCVKENGDGIECASGKGLDAARSIVVSRDGRHVYVASFVSSAVAVFARNKKTGILTQLAGADGCVKENGDGIECASGKGLAGAMKVITSRDGKQVYVASRGGGAVAVFSRDKITGLLTQLADTAGCVSDTGNGGDCGVGRALAGARSVALSKDGKHLYVTSDGSDAVAIFAREK